MTSFTSTDKNILTFVYIAVTIIGTFGNFVVITSICGRKKARKVQSNILMLSLSLSDLLACALCGPYYTRSLHVREFIKNAKNKIPLCLIMLLGAYIFALESILSLTLMSLDRYLAVRFPFWYQQWVTRKRCVAVVCFSWTYSIVTTIPAVIVPGWVAYENQPGSPCGFQWDKASSSFVAFHISVSLVIPLIVITFTNTVVFTTARAQNRKIGAALKMGTEKPDNVTTLDNAPLPSKISMGNTVGNVSCPEYCSDRRGSAYNVLDRLNAWKCKHSAKRERLRATSALLLAGTFYEQKMLLAWNATLENLKINRLSAANKIQTKHQSLENLDRLASSFDEAEASTFEMTSQLIHLHLPTTRLCSSETNLSKFRGINSCSAGKVSFKFLPPKKLQRKYSKVKIKATAKAEMKLALATIILSSGFTLSWLPFIITRILGSTGTKVSERATNYGTVFTLLSSAWNPYIVLLTRREILAGFKTVLNSFHKMFCTKRGVI